MTAWHDDMAGISRTYAMGYPRTTVSQVVGSTSMFMVVVNAIVAGTLGALVARRLVGDGPTDIHFPTPQGGSVEG